jgi:hypothetical protein
MNDDTKVILVATGLVGGIIALLLLTGKNTTGGCSTCLGDYPPLVEPTCEDVMY